MFNQIEPTNQTEASPINEEPIESGGVKLLLANKKVLVVFGIILLFIILLVTWLIFNFLKRPEKIVIPAPATGTEQTVTTTVGVLPTDISTSTDDMATSTAAAELEKYSFNDFFTEPAPIPEFNFKDYALPLNVKIDVLNYYDVSRKLSLDSSISSLNTNGFAILNNPSEKDIKDFYSAYSWLSNKEVPLLITSDFLMHYHQNVIKQAFKDIEENIFYDNLWRISKSLYESSKSRYEARLAKIGKVNDSILEGERLAMAYFAVALKLLEPSITQIDVSGKDVKKFSVSEASNLSFTLLPYLQSDAGEEINLIKAARGIKKSPVLLYQQNYVDFVVPTEYRSNEKLYNFYLASKWLNSVFPLVIKDKVCPTCLLDKEDARLSLIASSFITKDFSSDQDLKNRWALVYKLVSYSKGLREDLNYRNYDETMKALFGNEYDPELIFVESNPDSSKNMDKLRSALLALEFNSFQGGLDKNKDKTDLGFKLLSDYYFPNEYIFNRLSGAAIGKYNGQKVTFNNYTICKQSTNRCGGFSLDIVGLVTDKLASSSYWQENTSFTAYPEHFLALKNELKNASIWHNNNFWSMLGTIKMIFNSNNDQSQAYFRTELWRERLVDTAGSAWVDLQLPLEQLIPASAPVKKGLSNEVFFNDNFYIEPNYALVQKLIADNEMMYGMLDVMGINKKVSSVAIALKDENSKLQQFLELIKKELNGEAFNSDNQSFINSFAKQYEIKQAPVNQLYLKSGDGNLREELSIKLITLVYESGEGKYIAVGPIFSYKEGR